METKEFLTALESYAANDGLALNDLHHTTLRRLYRGGCQLAAVAWEASEAEAGRDVQMRPHDLEAQALAVAALAELVRADNCGYHRETMAYEGMFERARLALIALTGRAV